jgi:hypothetical protein
MLVGRGGGTGFIRGTPGAVSERYKISDGIGTMGAPTALLSVIGFEP